MPLGRKILHVRRVEERVTRGWFEHVSRRARWLVGVSGGADSVALLRAMKAARFTNVIVCHADHGLRGRASTGDANFVRELAEECGYVCEVGRLPVARRMKERGESMETAARHERYAFFESCAKKHRCRRIALAHHADDQAETVLWNLLRGSHGPRGMAAVKKLGACLEIHRPFLGLRKSELTAWLRANGWKWREDASNLTPIAVRNRLRNEVFPLLAEIMGRDVVSPLARLAEDARETEDFLHELAEQARPLDPQGRLHLGALRAMPVILRRIVVKEYLTKHGVPGINRRMLDEAGAMIDGGAAVINLPGEKRLRRRQGRMFVE